MPSATVSRVIAAPRPQVWAVLSDIANARRWNASWSKIEITSKQTHGVGASFRAYTKDNEAFDFEVTGWVAPEYIAFSPIRDESEQYGIALESHAFRLEATGENETRVELAAQASARGIRGRVTALLFWPGYQRQGLDLALDALQAVFEPEEQDEAEPEPETTPTAD